MNLPPPSHRSDFYHFDLRPGVADPTQWPRLSPLFAASQARAGQGSPSKIERDFVNPMRIIRLSVPEGGEWSGLQEGEDAFQRGMQAVAGVVAGKGGDIPVEVTPAERRAALDGWEAGRVGINTYFETLNSNLGMTELKLIPAAADGDFGGRSFRAYNDYSKKVKLCQNRGGPSLAAAWGGLMVTGTVQDSCGIPPIEEYFYQ